MTPREPNEFPDPPAKRKRRPRYSGTHPKDFAHKYKEHNIEAYPEMETHLREKGVTPATTHVPVLMSEVMEWLRPGSGEIVLDCTVGYGGHAAEFMRRIGATGRLVAMDVDGAELERTRLRLSRIDVPASFHRSNFAGIAKVLQEEKLDGFDIVFADLGVSSMQIDDPERGMSYKHEGPLDLRMDDRLQQTGADLINTLPEEELANALWELADEPDHREIARMVAARRAKQPITRTTELVGLVFDAKSLNPRAWRQEQQDAGLGALHPAARTFQALRIMVNDELGSLKELLRLVPYCLRPDGRIGIISFHSGEDRLVKKAFREGERNGTYRTIARDVITPGPEESRRNPRSSSAKFRWAVKA